MERTFGSIKSLFSQHVNTYTGNDITRRARTMDGEVLYNLSQLDDLLQAWIALGWQRRRHEELQNPYDANLPTLSPNQMFSACVQVAVTCRCRSAVRTTCGFCRPPGSVSVTRASGS
ncbi:hypothetical protein [Streptomyces sp. N1]|uniref:hypothetical protein n=1 Tax=Streptomyces sp. N1 TaxID=576456 RepID=UPI00101377EA|nr:hypothetical protein [Streptomyces sp. N1]